MNKIDELKKNKQPLILMNIELQNAMLSMPQKEFICLQDTSSLNDPQWTANVDAEWIVDANLYNVFRLRPDYEDEPEIVAVSDESVTGRTVLVYDRYHFAVPLKGQIQEVSPKDGAYKIRLYEDQHGYPNYMKFSGLYYHHQQCELQDVDLEIKNEPEILECEIYSLGTLFYRDIGGIQRSLSKAIECPDFIGFLFADGIVKGSPVKYSVPGITSHGYYASYEDLKTKQALEHHATSVLFRRKKQE